MTEKDQKKPGKMKKQNDELIDTQQEKKAEMVAEELLETAEAASESESPNGNNSGKKNGDNASEKSLQEQLEASEASLKEATDRILRLSAEFDNYKKRMARETEEFRKYANEVLIKNFLSVIDNLERAMESSKNRDVCLDSIVEGVGMTHKEIISVLEKFNVKIIDCVQKPFDPEFHQAVCQEETDELPENMVIRELMKGYMLHDRLIRPSMVVVSKSKTEKKSISETV